MLAKPQELQYIGPTFKPLPTTIHRHADHVSVHFGDRTYRIEPGEKPGEHVVVGDMRGWEVSAKTRTYTFKRSISYSTIRILPGFGFYLERQTPTGNVIRDLLRAEDGRVSSPFYQRPTLVSFGVSEDGLTAQRSLLVTGARRPYTTQGIGIELTLTWQPQLTEAGAWLFNEQGVEQTWAGVVDLSARYGFPDEPQYALTSEEGHVSFAVSAGEDSLTVHSFSPELRHEMAHANARVVHLQREHPTSGDIVMNQIGEHTYENDNISPSSYDAAVLVPVGQPKGWYRRLKSDGRLDAPGGGLALKPLSRARRFTHPTGGSQPREYTLVYGFLIAHATPQGLRYGWASPGFTAATGPIWRQAFLYESELIPQQTTRQLSLDPTLLVAESVTGGWQSFAEPKVQFELSTFTEPNTFSGYIPPAGSAEDAVAMAEGVVAGLDRKRGELAAERLSSTLAAMAEERRAATRRRLAAQGEREKFWADVFAGLAQETAKGVTFEPSSQGSKPSALGPDYRWDGNTLIHVPSHRTVR